MSDEEANAPMSRLGGLGGSHPTPAARKRMSFSALTHSLQDERDVSTNPSTYESSRPRNRFPPLPSSGSTPPTPNRKRRNRFSAPPSGSQSFRVSSGQSSGSFRGARRPSTRSNRRTSVTFFSRLKKNSSYDDPFSNNSDSELAADTSLENRVANYRRYRVGELCLVDVQEPGLFHLVNRYGFPSGKGDSPREQRGPYVYVVATVKKVHFEEDAEYYTVCRFDTDTEQRADTERMVWIPQGSTGADAAIDSALSYRRDAADDNDDAHSATDDPCLQMVVAPFLWLLGMTRYPIKAGRFIKGQAKLFLYGAKPYSLSSRITAVNVAVFCNAWVLFMDQLRLAFLPPAADFPIAVISCTFWVILVMELFVEVFIRPDDYRTKIVSEEAYNPRTVRFINRFHLLVESIALFAFIPEFSCLFSNEYTCSDRNNFSFFNGATDSVLGPHRIDTFYGRVIIALSRLRVFGLVRHWKKMWTTKTFVAMKPRSPAFMVTSRLSPDKNRRKRDQVKPTKEQEEENQKDSALTNASHIGTALMVVNSHRAMTVFFFIFGLSPLIFCAATRGGANANSVQMVDLLQANNVAFDTADVIPSCLAFAQTVNSWIFGITNGNYPQIHSETDIYLLSLQIHPIDRCTPLYPDYDGAVTLYYCRFIYESNATLTDEIIERCRIWGYPNGSITTEALAERADIRTGAVSLEVASYTGDLFYPNGTVETVEYRIEARFNDTFSVEPAAFGSFLLQFSLLVCILGFLSILRRDASVLVLGPLRRMLKIVAQYAKNPLATVKSKSSKDRYNDEAYDGGDSSSSEDGISQENDLGSFETEQLINAVSKITDLLRKCWGVAGAGIISTHLAHKEGESGLSTQVFDPNKQGTSVYALFAFCAVNSFDHYLRALGGDVMILINDVASVLHSEVFRWGLGDCGQCNKNLGSAWLMVFRIGTFEDVRKKLDEATNVVFSNTQKTHANRGGTRRRKGKGSVSSAKKSATTNAMTLKLEQLPGIAAFTDRALIGILKTFAGIYRDDKLLNWTKDFRLGAGVGAFSVNMIFGMDAGWAQEGAVGSEYKVDATYLSPHVNMASRMMSACKQYGVSILVSQDVQELLSDTAQSKLRHLDTVTVKGSSVRQKIFAYDARHKGADFFLFGKTDEQADMDSDQYNTNIWNTDRDLTAMRQHITEDFQEEFDRGRQEYLAGNWPSATKHLETANEILLQNMVEQGYIEYELNELQSHALDDNDARLAEQEFRNETEDGPSRRLLAFMKSQGGVAPRDWEGYRPLTSK